MKLYINSTINRPQERDVSAANFLEASNETEKAYSENSSVEIIDQVE